ncbi:MAG: DUF4209 domain-containing protein [Rhodospirillales bacterium]|nr:DUF4209 domain-containing protein [Alphaproteobacteria bacterium]MCB9981331.1 DUF4209 domain-containing protein [Rhodospirillales bacterium]
MNRLFRCCTGRRSGCNFRNLQQHGYIWK